MAQAPKYLFIPFILLELLTSGEFYRNIQDLSLMIIVLKNQSYQRFVPSRLDYENILYLERPGCNLCMGNQEKAAKGDTVLKD